MLKTSTKVMPALPLSHMELFILSGVPWFTMVSTIYPPLTQWICKVPWLLSVGAMGSGQQNVLANLFFKRVAGLKTMVITLVQKMLLPEGKFKMQNTKQGERKAKGPEIKVLGRSERSGWTSS